MKSFETRNNYKITFVISTIVFIIYVLLLLYILTKVLYINKTYTFNELIKQEFFISQLIFVVFLGLITLIILILKKHRKSKIFQIDDNYVRFISSKKLVEIPLSDITDLKLYSSKIVTPEKSVFLPLGSMINFAEFLQILKSEVGKKIPSKTISQIDKVIKWDHFKTHSIKVLFFYPIYFVSVFLTGELMLSHLVTYTRIYSKNNLFTIFTGLFSIYIAELLRYVEFSKRFDINSRTYTELKIRNIWYFYVIAFFIWVVFALIGNLYFF